ncbi:hypothetical protein [Sulfurimonas autotrophica]|uniref:Uncharacterized protein n=1 Tax=Sulfurimonas autotrophica (strain ATCC BAA-671 / DSM 16294 / JCM 11897 / OK10) TaxID=563040 RepID=E0US39_SULAO|nr:hypothetical protein [Sulfurimonas autotrophica]ADN09062.1 hypothetical protein Saut_1013 [Sulfurimonas autotrophica DSM 16294]
MRKNKILVSLVASVAFMSITSSSVLAYDKNPPFKLDKLKQYTEVGADGKKLEAMSRKMITMFLLIMN